MNDSLAAAFYRMRSSSWVSYICGTDDLSVVDVSTVVLPPFFITRVKIKKNGGSSCSLIGNGGEYV